MLEYTSCLFATVAVHAFACGVPSYQYIFQLVTILSICNYTAANNAYVRIIDTIVAHVAFIFVMLDTPTILEKNLEWLFVFPVAVIFLWVAEHVFLYRKNLIHAALHVVAAVGANVFILFLHSKCAF